MSIIKWDTNVDVDERKTVAREINYDARIFIVNKEEDLVEFVGCRNSEKEDTQFLLQRVYTSTVHN